MPEKRKRGQNFSFLDKEKLITLLLQCKDTILNKKTDGTTNEAKTAAWLKLTDDFNSTSNVYRTKDSLIKLWEKLKSDAKTYNAQNRTSTTGTGGGPSTSKYDPILEQMCIILGRGCTGIEGVNNNDAVVTVKSSNDSQMTRPTLPVTSDLHVETTIDQYAQIEIDSDSEQSQRDSKISKMSGTSTSYVDPNTETINLKTPLWERRRHTQTNKNERDEAYTELVSSYKDVNSVKFNSEDLKLQLLKEEIDFKKELHKYQLEGAMKEVELKNIELKIKQEILSQLQGGSGALQRQNSPQN